MNRFTDLSKSVRQKVKDQRLAAESEADRAKRLAEEKYEAQVDLLGAHVMPLLEEAKDGLVADQIDVSVALRRGGEPATVLLIDAGLSRIDDNTFEVGESYELLVTTAGGAFLIRVKGGLKGQSNNTATTNDIEEVLIASMEDLLDRYHGAAK